MSAKTYIGTSGYTYDHWRGVFYPEDLASYKWLEYYMKFFKTVELNVTFYRLPQESVFKSWCKRTPKDFIFVLKGSRFITHVKKLHGTKEAVKLFFNRASLLKEKLGVVLWQLPPSWKKNVERLESFLKVVSHYKVRQVFEFRHESWFCDEVYKLLKKYKVALCIADSPEFPTAEVVTADFIYIRFHGGKILYGSRYSRKEMQEWAKKIKAWTKKGLDVYAYFNNDASGYAVENARELKKLLNC
jgi:uncharacterized protein YecE (DUF72 family)